MNETSFQGFINLVELDAKIDTLALEAESLKKQIADLEAQIAATQLRTQNAYQKAHTLRKSVDALELELKALEELQHEKKFRLGLASSPKEFFSLEHEIAALEKKHAQADEQGIETINQLEEAQKAYESLKAQEPVEIDQKRHALAELESRFKYVTDLRHAYVEQHGQFEKGVPDELLAKYASMKGRVQNPVVEILRDSCSACFYAINKPDLLAAEKHQLITCKDCYRLLYKGSYGKQDISS